MAKYEWVRTALAIDQTGSITAGAEARNISQPAASQQLAALEAALGQQLFARHRGGVSPTTFGARFLRQVSGPFEQIAWLLDGLDAGAVQPADPPIVIGCSPEWFERTFLPLMSQAVTSDLPTLQARFGSESELLDDLSGGSVDLAVTARRGGSSRVKVLPVGAKRYVLVASSVLAPEAVPVDIPALAQWIRRTPWVGFSEELPVTRRFWREVTGSTQPTELVLVAPDLRVVANAVERGLGASLLPSHVCDAALAEGRLQEVCPVADLVPNEPWFLSVQPQALDRRPVAAIVDLLTGSVNR